MHRNKVPHVWQIPILGYKRTPCRQGQPLSLATRLPETQIRKGETVRTGSSSKDLKSRPALCKHICAQLMKGRKYTNPHYVAPQEHNSGASSYRVICWQVPHRCSSTRCASLDSSSAVGCPPPAKDVGLPQCSQGGLFTCRHPMSSYVLVLSGNVLFSKTNTLH